MDRIIKFVLKQKYIVVALFIIAAAISAIASSMVKINYNLMDYLPDSSPSTIALNTMNEEYTDGVPNARVMIKNASVPHALEIKEKIKKVNGVEDVSWLDDSVNIYEPVEYIDKDLTDDYYKDGNALFTVTIDEDKQEAAVKDIRAIIGDEGCMSGNAVNTATAVELTAKEIQRILVLAVFIIFVILLLTTSSYFEPVLFLLTMGIAIVLNMGTNLLFGEISFVTNSAGSILQLAVSMDYSIFLVHRFEELREDYEDTTDAMVQAVKKSFGSVMSSGLTTVMGFAALILMKFKIGPDMGIVMAKAIAISLFTVLLFLPSATLLTYKYIDKTQHKFFIPPMDGISKFVAKHKKTIMVLFVLCTIPSYFAQNCNSFIYGQSGIYGKGTQLGDDTAEIEEIFGKSNLMVLMVPKGHYSEEKALSKDLNNEKPVTSVLSYSDTVGTTLPEEFVPEDTLKKLVSKDYSRFVITVDAETENQRAFGEVEKIRNIAKKYYGDKYLLVGETVNSFDLKDVVTEDNKVVNILSVGSIALILLFNFKSVSLPIMLLLAIEASVWLNLAVPYFANQTIFYIGYLIISSIQLGATVDYAILFADRYIENRSTMLPEEAMEQSLSNTVLSILTSATILTVAGFALGLLSSNKIISQLGILVGRGAILSGVMVLLVLPILLSSGDFIIRKTTLKLNFCKEEKKIEEE